MEKHSTCQLILSQNSDPELSAIIDIWRLQRKNLIQKIYKTLIVKTIRERAASKVVDTPKSKLHYLQSLSKFCEHLIDYVSAGHFEIYEKLLKKNHALVEEKTELINNIYHSIETSTDLALNFNDKYINQAKSLSYKTLLSDLEKLKRSLSVRFVLEEQLVEILNPSKLP